MIRIFIYPVLVVLIVSCAEKKLSPAKYCQWIEEAHNGLKVSQQKGEYVFTLQYKPWEYMTIKEGGDNFTSMKEINHKGQQYQELQQFNLQISTRKSNGDALRSGINSEDEFKQRISYFSYPVQHELFLADDKDTLPCILYHFERSYNLTPYCNMVLGFNATKNAITDKTVIYKDRTLGTGQINLVISKSAISKIPQINLPE